MVDISIFLFRIFCISILCGLCSGLECYKNLHVNDTGPVVVTTTGVVVGKYIRALNKESAAFLGIPFAKPPLGEKRFRYSERIERWDGAYLAKENPPGCMQYSPRKFDWIPSRISVSEDCLYLNIWLPPNCCCNRKDKLPVMVWIHGGGYSQGSISMDIYNGSVLASLGEVIVVTINYRLGIFGFLNVDTKTASGNMGLHDQLLALQWVRENIQYFGGDPNRLTLFGESAGALAISLLMVSPHSRNLFHKAILESGTSNQPFLVDNVTVSIIKANEFSKIIGCSNSISDLRRMPNDVVQCLKKKSAVELARTENIFTSKFPAFFLPSYGNECNDCFNFFVESPVKSIQSGEFAQIPTLLGNTQNEGSIFLVYRQPDVFKLDRKPSFSVSQAKQVLKSVLANMPIPSDHAFDYYVQNIMKEGSKDIVGVMEDILGDYIFKCPNMYFADQLKEGYYYWFNHRSLKDVKHDWIGVPHFAEVAYVFGKPITETQKYTPEDRKFSEDLISKFTSFARDSYPKDSTHKWVKYSPSQRLVNVLNSRSKGSIQLPGLKACEFWKPYLHS